MIVDLILGVVSLILKILAGILSAIPLAVPSSIQSSFLYFAGYVSLAGGYIDIQGTMAAFNFMLNFMIAWFTFKAVMWIYHTVFARRAHEKQALPVQSK